MKILQLVQKPQRRGAEVFAYQLTRELRQRQHEVRIAYLYPFDGPGRLSVEEPDSILDGNAQSLLERIPGIHPGLLKRLRKLIAAFQPDIVQANGARTVKYAAFACGSKEKLIYRNIGNPQDWVQGWPRRFFYKNMVMPRMDGIVGVSRTTLDRLLHFYGLSSPAVHIPRGIDLSSTVPKSSRDSVRRAHCVPLDVPVVLYLGSLTPEKRPDRFLRVVHQLLLKLPEIHAWIVGDGPMKLELERQVDSKGLKNTVHFFGVQNDVASIIGASDLLLLTSDTEGIPGVVLEAGSLRVPVVATSVGAVHECVVNHETGILVDPRDEEGFSRAALDVLENPEKRREMGQRARDYVLENFDICEIASKYLDFYHSTLKR